MNTLTRILLKKRFEFFESENGNHQLGGDFPKEFTIPQNDFKASFQYLGFIDNSAKIFKWLPFRLHLICPIFLNIEMVFIDYENPNSPQIIYPSDSAAITTEYDDLKNDSTIQFGKVAIALRPISKPITEENDDEIIGIAGKPVWEQNPVKPKCPKSGKEMKFVCQLFSSGKVKTSYTNVQAKNDYYQNCFSDMNFWEDGYLFVFFEPSSKVACYFIQN